ncbi:MAG: adenylate/guanylate cyclase domain-containing protein [Leptospiraceae bacterium]|nr:adenylate/guanylate cyclase domain-containing protein [Leptospiraceae bacterium]
MKWISTAISLTFLYPLSAGGTPVNSGAKTVNENAITSLATADGGEWQAAPGKQVRSESAKPLRTKTAPIPEVAYKTVSVPGNLSPQLGISGLEIAHYRSRFILTKLPTEPMALRLGEINDRDIVYLNGSTIGRTGDFDSPRPQAYDKVRIYALPPGLLRTGENEIVVELKGVLEKESGLYRDRVEIGPAAMIFRAYYLENLWGSLALVCYLTFGLYFLLFFIRRRHDRENFYFAVFAIALVIYSGLHTQLKYEYALPLYILKKIQYIALFVLVPAFYYFIRNYYKLPTATWAKLLDYVCFAANAVMIGAGAAVAVSGDVKLWDFLQNNIVTYVWLVYIVGMAVILIREVIKKNRDAIIMIVSFTVLLAAMFLDILSGRAVINLPPLLTYVFIIFILSMALVLANRFVRLHDETEQLNESLSRFNAASRRFVPFEFLNMLDKKSILDVNLGDQVQRNMAVLFSDIRSFTALSEKMTPKENFDFINSYLDKVGPVIRDHKGFIDKYIGDAVMALFPESAADALEAALGMHDRVRRWNERRAVHGYAAVAIGIGVHEGRVMLGTIGEHARMDGTVIADAVNLASRIESLTKNYGAGTLISDVSWNSISDKSAYGYRLVDRVAVKGKNEPVGLIEVFNSDSDEVRRMKERQKPAFQEALLYYQKGDFQQAKTAFLQLMAENNQDKTLKLYLTRIEQHLKNPPIEWLGYDVLTEK